MLSNLNSLIQMKSLLVADRLFKYEQVSLTDAFSETAVDIRIEIYCLTLAAQKVDKEYYQNPLFITHSLAYDVVPDVLGPEICSLMHNGYVLTVVMEESYNQI